MPDEPYMLGSSVKEALSMVIRSHHELHDIVMTLQERVLALEMQVRCTHLFKTYTEYMECVHCTQRKGF